VLGDAGFLFDVPDHYTPQTRLVPTAGEVAPWVETAIRLWDDDAFYDEASRRSLRAADLWRPDRLAVQYEAFFETIAENSACGVGK